jgi:hypothetical protein
MASLEQRVQRLETQFPGAVLRRPFLWASGQSLAEALGDAKLTLDDKPLFAIRLIGVEPGRLDEPECPLYLRDRHLLDA